MAGWLYRIGRAAAAHRLVFIGVWLVLVAVAVVSVRALGAETNNTLTLPGTDSQAAFDLLAAKFPPQQNGANPFVLQVDRGTLSDPNYKPAVDATYRAFKASRYVPSRKLESPFPARFRPLVSPGGNPRLTVDHASWITSPTSRS